eukprot:CAMPEP_0177628774 /NCGR_PEP_ID=MMETSP0447-20121125/311_1 /TAXON_ID=0 /ORGANISM="Stygamoeba regulata, Strain BSH-02190019" /LENGTH=675 /DNA_ID=CAMNT_0019130045 /DNA_START=267 /DNA_END=2294 /DNA_ORIENTATION=+
MRLSGSTPEIQAYKRSFDLEEEPDVREATDVHLSASLLKLYLRELPEPLMTFAAYEPFIAADAETEENLRLKYFRLLIHSLPPPNKLLFFRLFEVLKKISENHEVNKMNSKNLAVVIGPTILRRENEDMMNMMNDASAVNNIAESLLLHLEAMREPPELGCTGWVRAVQDHYLVPETDKASSSTDTAEEDVLSKLSFKKGDLIFLYLIHPLTGEFLGEIHGRKGLFSEESAELMADFSAVELPPVIPPKPKPGPKPSLKPPAPASADVGTGRARTGTQSMSLTQTIRHQNDQRFELLFGFCEQMCELVGEMQSRVIRLEHDNQRLRSKLGAETHSSSSDIVSEELDGDHQETVASQVENEDQQREKDQKLARELSALRDRLDAMQKLLPRKTPIPPPPKMPPAPASPSRPVVLTKPSTDELQRVIDRRFPSLSQSSEPIPAPNPAPASISSAPIPVPLSLPTPSITNLPMSARSAQTPPLMDREEPERPKTARLPPPVSPVSAGELQNEISRRRSSKKKKSSSSAIRRKSRSKKSESGTKHSASASVADAGPSEEGDDHSGSDEEERSDANVADTEDSLAREAKNTDGASRQRQPVKVSFSSELLSSLTPPPPPPDLNSSDEEELDGSMEAADSRTDVAEDPLDEDVPPPPPPKPSSLPVGRPLRTKKKKKKQST